MGKYVIQPGERPRSLPFRPLRQQSSDSDLRNLIKHMPEGIPIEGKGLARVQYRSLSRPRAHLARSDPTSNSTTHKLIQPKEAGILVVEHTPMREVHTDHHAGGGTLRQLRIYTPHREPTAPEMHRTLEFHAPTEAEVFQHHFNNMKPRKQRKYETSYESGIARAPRLGIQIYDKFGSMSTTTRGTEQGPRERIEDDEYWLASYGNNTRHVSNGKCTEHGNNNQMYQEWGLSNLPRPERIRTLREAGVRTTTIDAGSLEAVSGCPDQPKRNSIGCKTRNTYLGATDVSTNRKSGRHTDIYHKVISDSDYERHVSRARERGEFPPQRKMFEFDSESLRTRSSGSSGSSGRAKSRTRRSKRS